MALDWGLGNQGPAHHPRVGCPDDSTQAALRGSGRASAQFPCPVYEFTLGRQGGSWVPPWGPAFLGQRGTSGRGRISLLPAAPGEGHTRFRAGLDPGEGATPVSKGSRTSGSFCPIPCGIKIV